MARGFGFDDDKNRFMGQGGIDPDALLGTDEIVEDKPETEKINFRDDEDAPPVGVVGNAPVDMRQDQPPVDTTTSGTAPAVGPKRAEAEFYWKIQQQIGSVSAEDNYGMYQVFESVGELSDELARSDEGPEIDLSDLYLKVREKCQYYISTHNPKSPRGKKRLRLVRAIYEKAKASSPDVKEGAYAGSRVMQSADAASHRYRQYDSHFEKDFKPEDYAAAPTAKEGEKADESTPDERRALAAIKKAKAGGRKVSLKYIFSKLTHTGGVCISRLKFNKKDAIGKLGKERGDTFYNPFAKLGEGDLTDEQKALEEAFVNRVDAQIEQVKKNDFEAGKNGRDETTGLAAAISEEDYRNDHDAAKGFVPDYLYDNAKDSDQFYVGLGVNPGAENYDAMNDRIASETSSLTAKIKQFFGGKKVDKKDQDYQVQTAVETAKDTDTYKRLVEAGEKAAKADGKKYDPEKDPRIISYLGAVCYSNVSNSTGHGFVRLMTTADKAPASSYSFGYYVGSESGIANVTQGKIINPEKQASSGTSIEKRYEIPYKSYLNAASKIRGIMGSSRTYSLQGYNCSAFAIDIAREAGVSIPEDDVSVNMMSFRHHSLKVETPAMLAKFIRAEKAREKDLPDREEFGLGESMFTEKMTDVYGDSAMVKGFSDKYNTAMGQMRADLMEALEKNPVFINLKKCLIGPDDTKTKDFVDEIEKTIIKVRNEAYKAEPTGEGNVDTIIQAHSKATVVKEKMREAFGVDNEYEFIKRLGSDPDTLCRALLLKEEGKQSFMDDLMFNQFSENDVFNFLSMRRVSSDRRQLSSESKKKIKAKLDEMTLSDIGDISKSPDKFKNVAMALDKVSNVLGRYQKRSISDFISGVILTDNGLMKFLKEEHLSIPEVSEEELNAMPAQMMQPETPTVMPAISPILPPAPTHPVNQADLTPQPAIALAAPLADEQRKKEEQNGAMMQPDDEHKDDLDAATARKLRRFGGHYPTVFNDAVFDMIASDMENDDEVKRLASDVGRNLQFPFDWTGNFTNIIRLCAYAVDDGGVKEASRYREDLLESVIATYDERRELLLDILEILMTYYDSPEAMDLAAKMADWVF